MAVLTSFLYFALVLASPFMAWRWNPAIAGYGWNRTWTLLAVHGQKSTGHMDQYYGACTLSATLMTSSLTICRTGLCMHYRHKCSAYALMSYASYGVASILMFCAFFAFINTFMACRGTSYTLKIANAFWGAIMFFQVVSLALYYNLTEDVFDQVGAKSWYPKPAPNTGIFVNGFAACVGGLCSCFTCQLYFKARNSELGIIEDDFDSEEDD